MQLPRIKFRPNLIDALAGYRRTDLIADVGAGLSEGLPRIRVLEMPQVINLDTTGLDALKGLHRHLERQGGRLILAELNEQPLSLVRRSGFLNVIGPENIVPRLDAAYDMIRAGS